MHHSVTKIRVQYYIPEKLADKWAYFTRFSKDHNHYSTMVINTLTTFQQLTCKVLSNHRLAEYMWLPPPWRITEAACSMEPPSAAGWGPSKHSTNMLVWILSNEALFVLSVIIIWMYEVMLLVNILEYSFISDALDSDNLSHGHLEIIQAFQLRK